MELKTLNRNKKWYNRRLTKRIMSLFLSFVIMLGLVPMLELPTEVSAIANVTASQVVANMAVGYNLGNTFDSRAHSMWQPVPTRATIQAVHAAGFDTIRIPVTWTAQTSGLLRGHSGNNWTISDTHMDRVFNAVSWAYELGMTVVINAHHEDAIQLIMVSNPTLSDQIHTRIWTQITARFNNQFGERLIFSGSNEPRTNLSDFSGDAAQRAAVNRQNQLFVNTVRASGGNNRHRSLMIVGVAASATPANMNAITLPNDPQSGNGISRFILTAHTYSPFGFSFRNSGSMRTTTYSRTGSGHGGPERINHYFGNIATAANNLTPSGQPPLPVILGEWGAEYDGNNSARRVHAQHYVELARARGWVPILWCNGSLPTYSGERFGFLDRTNNTFRTQALPVIEGIMAGRGGGVTPSPTVTATPSSVSITSRTASDVNVTIGGTATGTITFSRPSGMPAWITTSVSTSNNRLTVGLATTGVPTTAQSWTGNVTVTRQGVNRTVAVTVTLPTAEPVGVVSFATVGNHTFPPAAVGYGTQAHYTKRINRVSGAPGQLTARLSGTNANSFRLRLPGQGSGDWVGGSLELGTPMNASSGNREVEVRPAGSLPVGTHTATVTIEAANANNLTFNVTFVVSAAQAPTITATPSTVNITSRTAAPINVAIGGTATGTISRTNPAGMPSWLTTTVSTSNNRLTVELASTGVPTTMVSWSGNVTVTRGGVSTTVAITVNLPAVSPPTITATPSTVSINSRATDDVNVAIGGTATGTITVSRPTGMPAWLTTVASNTNNRVTIRLSGVPSAAQSWSGNITVTRGGVSTNVAITVTLSEIITTIPAELAMDSTSNTLNVEFGFGSNDGRYSRAVSNSGTQATGALTITLSGANANNFRVRQEGDSTWHTGTAPLQSLSGGESSNIQLRPSQGLAIGTYTATVTVSGANVVSRSFNIILVVTPAGGGGIDPTFGVSITPTGTLTFPEATVGYSGMDFVQTRVVTNTGNQPTGVMRFRLSGDDAESFRFFRPDLPDNQHPGGRTDIAGIPVGGAFELNIRPAGNLPAGIYVATVTVYSNVDNPLFATQTFEISLTIVPVAVCGDCGNTPCDCPAFDCDVCGYVDCICNAPVFCDECGLLEEDCLCGQQVICDVCGYTALDCICHIEFCDDCNLPIQNCNCESKVLCGDCDRPLLECVCLSFTLTTVAFTCTCCITTIRLIVTIMREFCDVNNERITTIRRTSKRASDLRLLGSAIKNFERVRENVATGETITEHICPITGEWVPIIPLNV
ncbi:MAG: cellulase family glycosylhydrolase [Oscillospiraceae bacterium]|nr:cellulase family glycosylhydrolase [Oscillospiraceae bacterium]